MDGLEQARDELEGLLVEVLGAMFGELAESAEGQDLPPGPAVSSRVAILDPARDCYTTIEVRTGAAAARILACRMMMTSEPTVDDLLDAMAELGNIAGGNVKSLLRQACRLSLPTAEITEAALTPELADGGVVVRAGVLGQVIELRVYPADRDPGLYWPGSTHPDVLEKQS